MITQYVLEKITGLEVHWDEATSTIDIRTPTNLHSRTEPVIAGTLFSGSIQASIGGFELGISPDVLLQLLNTRNLAFNPFAEYQDWDVIYANVENPVRDGRMYHEGADFTFSFRTEHMFFGYSQEGVHHFIQVLTPAYQTNSNIGVGDNRSRVLAAYGNSYESHPWDIIEFFDGERYMFFAFDDDIVLSWGVGSVSIMWMFG